MKKTILLISLLLIIILSFDCSKTDTPITPESTGKWELIPGPYGGNYYSIAVNLKEIYLGSDKGLAKSTDGGTTWNYLKNDFSDRKINALSYYKNYIFAATDTGLYKSSDGGSTWSQNNSGLTEKIINDIAITGSEIYLGTSKGVYKAQMMVQFGLQ
jgi:photosystem II stability/assembly factor-like uncharacterized protein